MDWKSIVGAIAPTVGTALLGPLGGAAVSAVGAILGLPSGTEDDVRKALETGKLTPEHVSKLRELELQYQNEERERGFRYAELAFKDRDSARQANVQGGTQRWLFALSCVILVITLGSELAVLFKGYPETVHDVVVGRVLGLMDSVSLLVLSYWYGSNSGSERKTELIAQAPPVR